MNTLLARSYEIKTARNGEKIPVVNGVHLHSSYNPTKEATALIEGHTSALKSKNEVLILGLGFGYHVNEVARILTETHGKSFSIVVVEPNNKIYEECLREGILKTSNVAVYTGTEAKDLYNHKELSNFLLRKPTVIAHPASFNLYQDFFKSFLSFEAPKTIGEMSERITSVEIQDYLACFSSQLTLDQIAEAAFTQNTKLKELDFLLLALRSMTSKSGKESQKVGEN